MDYHHVDSKLWGMERGREGGREGGEGGEEEHAQISVG